MIGQNESVPERRNEYKQATEAFTLMISFFNLVLFCASQSKYHSKHKVLKTFMAEGAKHDCRRNRLK